MPVLRNLDLVLLALALAIFLATGLPVLGWVAGAVIWALWRGIGMWSDHRAARATTAKETAGIAVGSMVGRGWLLGLILLGSGLALGSDVGLSAAVLVLVLFSVHFPSKLMVRDPETRRPSTT
jgi:hypothetical protein